MLNDYIQSKFDSTRRDVPWMTSKIKRSIKVNKAKKSSKPSDWATYKTSKKETPKSLRNQHWEYVNNIREKDNSGMSAIKAEGKLHYSSEKKTE